ncbi:glycoside hydrolase family 25 protein [Tieghemostelium lacteum]|uniref:Glycoside hydrolase family 25 protein n=1 Tax=Tieghemostelium lacteum TaxID=361077 RepID=A0A152A9T2_TIELA|nr:glycoside hydrolase family 25 protein [Tieghemostelium lacteum]|eukprot:KYR02895.1 glycoside hydrolase family 25 protein [Tieghemostelium lacteum]
MSSFRTLNLIYLFIILIFANFCQLSVGDWVNNIYYTDEGLSDNCYNQINLVTSFQTGICTGTGIVYECDYTNNQVVQINYVDLTCNEFSNNQTITMNSCQGTFSMNCSEKFYIAENTTTTLIYGPNCQSNSEPLIAHTTFLNICSQPFAILGQYWVYRTCNSTYLTINNYYDPNQPYSSSSGTSGVTATASSTSILPLTSGTGSATGSGSGSGDSGKWSTGGTSATGSLSGSESGSQSKNFWTPQCHPQYRVHASHIRLSNIECSPNTQFTICS